MYSQLCNEVRVVLEDKPEAPVTYRILNSDGHVVRKGQLSNNSKTHSISTNGMEEGSYRFETHQISVPFEKRKLFG